MTQFRTAMLALPFVSEKPNGTLDMWSVVPSGDPFYDVPTGRAFCAWFLHFVRDQDAAHVLGHVAHAFYDCHAEVAAPYILSGWGAEFAEALVAADQNSPVLQLAAGKMYSGSDLRTLRLSLPFVKERPDGSLNHFAVDAEAPEGAARGRYYAALCAKYIRDTGDLAIYPLLCVDFTAIDVQSPLALGWLTAACEIAASSTLTATPHQKAAKVHFEDARSAGA